MSGRFSERMGAKDTPSFDFDPTRKLKKRVKTTITYYVDEVRCVHCGAIQAIEGDYCVNCGELKEVY